MSEGVKNGVTILDCRMHKNCTLWSEPVRGHITTYPDGVLLEEGRFVHDAVLVVEQAHEPNLLQDVVPLLQAHPSSALSASSSSVQHRSSFTSYKVTMSITISLWQSVKQQKNQTHTRTTK